MTKIDIGGLTKDELFSMLEEHSIMLNDYAIELFRCDKFKTSKRKYELRFIETSVNDLGFPTGANLVQIYSQAKKMSLDLCPIEAAPYLRLHYLNQLNKNAEGSFTNHRAPNGSITIASEILSEKHDFPKGFYLRKINGDLWLRGYRCDYSHIFGSKDRFIFCRAQLQASSLYPEKNS